MNPKMIIGTIKRNPEPKMIEVSKVQHMINSSKDFAEFIDTFMKEVHGE